MGGAKQSDVFDGFGSVVEMGGEGVVLGLVG